MLTKGVQGYKRAGMNPGEAEIAQREKYTYRGPVSQDASISDDDYVTSLYNKYLGRDPDAEGFKYWKTLAGGDPTRRGKIESDFLKNQEVPHNRVLNHHCLDLLIDRLNTLLLVCQLIHHQQHKIDFVQLI